jgi:hypothetical protein
MAIKVKITQSDNGDDLYQILGEFRQELDEEINNIRYGFDWGADYYPDMITLDPSNVRIIPRANQLTTPSED